MSMTSTAQNRYTRQEIARTIDHTKLVFSPDEDPMQAIIELCQQAAENNFYAVCVRPAFVRLAKKTLADCQAKVKVATVIGFPANRLDLFSEQQSPTVGDVSTQQKLTEIRDALETNVDELDVVLNVRCFKQESASGHFPETQKELETLAQAAQNRPIKLIIETDLLTENEIDHAACLSAKTGMAMVKTSTGMLAGGKGATLEAVKRIRNALDHNGGTLLEIKASGGIKTVEQATQFLSQGANRLGTSAGITILEHAETSP